MSEEIKIRSTGIKKALNHFTPESAITEYMWNGFDAGATRIIIDADYNEPFGEVTEFRISDNGSGINYDLLADKFIPFGESEKSGKRTGENIAMQGKDGYGRFTFFKFAKGCSWNTIYRADNGLLKYQISINAESLEKYDKTEPIITLDPGSGTTVMFTGLAPTFHREFVEQRLTSYLRNEFGWFLEIHKEHNYEIIINGQKLTYEELLADSKTFSVDIKSSDRKTTYHFNCHYIQWNTKLNDEFSRFYFLNEAGKLKHHKTTKLNKKGDQFYHSIIVQSDFFENFNYAEGESEEVKTQQTRLFAQSEDYKIYKDLLDRLNSFLKRKRKPFLHTYSEKLIRQFENEKVMPKFGNNTWDKLRKDEFETLVRELYEVEPALFAKLNFEQKKTFLHLLNLVLDSDERGNLFNILEEIVSLEPEERADLQKLLQATRLSNVIKATKLVHDRILALEQIKALALNHDLKANERDHLQKAVEQHYWIFGEKYSLVCAAEVKFEEALRRYLYILRGETEKVSIDHPHKYKEMDVFMVRQDFLTDSISNAVVEIKNPTTIKRLTQKEFIQVQNYLSTIFATDDFNATTNSTWEFYLVGQDFDEYIQGQIDNARNHGEKGLAFKVGNYKIYVKKWSEVFNEVELRLRWLNEKLKVEREKLSAESESAAEALKKLNENSAVQPAEIEVPK